ncbi:MAG: hypothetical protein AB7G11_12560 [Phycisphaerales bacterium]
MSGCGRSTPSPSGGGSGGASGGSGSGHVCGTTGCPLADNVTVTIGPVKRGNPYVSSNAPNDGMPASVPPTKTYEVQVTLSNSLGGTPHYIELSIANGSADNGTATVSPTRLTDTATVTVTGANQTKEGHDGQLKIQAKLDGSTLKAESNGFSVCAHPINFNDTLNSDIDEAARVGFRVNDTWESDSGRVADLDKAEISEIVAYTRSDSPPFAALGSPVNNSGYLAADSFSTDSHTIGRPPAGPAGITTRDQLSIFKCKRCGANDKPQPNSGLQIKHEVYQAGADWKHKTSKWGAGVTINAWTVGAATTNPNPIVSSIHALP